jgi:hypothetical protein
LENGTKWKKEPSRPIKRKKDATVAPLKTAQKTAEKKYYG